MAPSMPSRRFALTVHMETLEASARCNHRLEKWIPDACRSRSELLNWKVVLTTTTNGVRKGIKVSDAEMQSLDITGDMFHPERNYTIKPRN